MARKAGRTFALLAFATLALVPPALAQTAAPPAATPSSAEADSESARRYEDAVRADAQGHFDDAMQLAEQGLALSPQGPFAPSLHRLIDRIAQEQQEHAAREHLQLTAPRFAARASPSAAKVTWVFSGAFAGIAEGLLIAGTTSADSSGVAAGGVIGLGVGVSATLASMSAVDDPAIPAHLWLGWIYGGFAGLMIGAQSDVHGQHLAGAIGLPLGAFGGVLAASLPGATEGDAVAGLSGLVNLAAVPVLFGFTASKGSLSSAAASGLALSGGTVGMIAGEWLNRDLHWSEGRWALIGVSGGLGAFVGALISLASSSPKNTTQIAGFAAGGDLVGLVVGVAATQGLPDEAPRGYRFPADAPAAARDALPPTQAPPGRSPSAIVVPLAVFAF